MAGAAGLEPVTSAVTGQRSNQLSYAPANVLRNGPEQASERKKRLTERQGEPNKKDHASMVGGGAQNFSSA